MAERKRKNSKIYSRQFKLHFFETGIVCYKFSNSSVFFRPYCRARKDLSKNIWVVALIVYRFRDKSENTKFCHLSAKQRTNLSSPVILVGDNLLVLLMCNRYIRDFRDGPTLTWGCAKCNGDMRRHLFKLPSERAANLGIFNHSKIPDQRLTRDSNP